MGVKHEAPEHSNTPETGAEPAAVWPKGVGGAAAATPPKPTDAEPASPGMVSVKYRQAHK